MPYSSYDHDKLEAAETMRIERRIYFEAKDREIAPYASLPIAQLLSMRSESAAAEQAIFDDLTKKCRKLLARMKQKPYMKNYISNYHAKKIYQCW